MQLFTRHSSSSYLFRLFLFSCFILLSLSLSSLFSRESIQISRFRRPIDDACKRCLEIALELANETPDAVGSETEIPSEEILPLVGAPNEKIPNSLLHEIHQKTVAETHSGVDAEGNLTEAQTHFVEKEIQEKETNPTVVKTQECAEQNFRFDPAYEAQEAALQDACYSSENPASLSSDSFSFEQIPIEELDPNLYFNEDANKNVEEETSGSFACEEAMREAAFSAFSSSETSHVFIEEPSVTIDTAQVDSVVVEPIFSPYSTPREPEEIGASKAMIASPVVASQMGAIQTKESPSEQAGIEDPLSEVRGLVFNTPTERKDLFIREPSPREPRMETTGVVSTANQMNGENNAIQKMGGRHLHADIASEAGISYRPLANAAASEGIATYYPMPKQELTRVEEIGFTNKDALVKASLVKETAKIGAAKSTELLNSRPGLPYEEPIAAIPSHADQKILVQNSSSDVVPTKVTTPSVDQEILPKTYKKILEATQEPAIPLDQKSVEEKEPLPSTSLTAPSSTAIPPAPLAPSTPSTPSITPAPAVPVIPVIPPQKAPVSPAPVPVRAVAPPVPAPAPIVPAPAPTPTPTTILVPTATPEATPNAAQVASLAQGYLINFSNVAITEYIRFISKITGKNFIFDEAELQFNVTIISEEPTTIENIMAALLQELRIHGLVLIDQGNNLIIHTNTAVNSPGKIVPPGLEGQAEVETRVFTLMTLGVQKTADLIRPLLSPQALIEPLPDTSNLVITDITPNIDKIAQLIKTLDSASGGFEIGQYLVINTVPDVLIALAEKVLAPLVQGKPVVLVPHNPTNSIYIVATPALVAQTLIVLKNLDVAEGQTRVLGLQGRTEEEEAALRAAKAAAAAAGEGISPELLTRPAKWTSEFPLGHAETTEFYIHKLQYRKGDQIEAALQKIADSLQLTGAPNNDLLSTIRSIQWIEASNSLIFTGTQESLDKIRDLITEIDLPLRQIFIEVLIIDTTIDNSLDFGVDWGARFGGPSVAGAEAFVSPTPTLPTIMDANGINGPVTLDPTLIARNEGFSLGVIGRNITKCGLTFNSIGAIVSALHRDIDTDIILNPKLIVEDNSTAEIFVGINAPFKTQSIANDLGNVITNNFEFRDIGASFRVTPFLGSDEMITMEIEEEVSEVAPDQGTSSLTGITTSFFTTTELLTGGPITRKSKTKTRLHVPDNFFVIMSGMVQTENSRDRSQVPCLGGVPVLGAAFSRKSMIDSKRNMMIFLRPHIIDTQEEYDQITKRQQDIWIDKTFKRKNSWKFEIDETYDLLNLEESDPDNIDCPD